MAILSSGSYFTLYFLTTHTANNRNLDGASTFSDDSIDGESTAYMVAKGFAGLMILVYPVGINAMYLGLLLDRRAGHHAAAGGERRG